MEAEIVPGNSLSGRFRSFPRPNMDDRRLALILLCEESGDVDQVKLFKESSNYDQLGL